MNLSRPLSLVAMLCGLTTLGACSAGQSPSADTPTSARSTSNSLIANAMDHAIDRARKNLRTQNITISDHDERSSPPKAQVTPRGDLRVAGKPIAVTPAQRAMLLDYRQQVVAIGLQGMVIGKQGAELGLHATREALVGALAGKSDEEVQQQVEAQASGIKQSAARLCSRLPEMMASQQKLAAALPAFKPYATMTQSDIDDCLKGANDDTAGARTGAATRDEIRSRIRKTIREATPGAGLASGDSNDATSPASTTTTARH